MYCTRADEIHVPVELAGRLTLENETPVWSLVMIWSTPSSRKAHVVARSAVGPGMGTLCRDMVVEVREGHYLR